MSKHCTVHRTTLSNYGHNWSKVKIRHVLVTACLTSDPQKRFDVRVVSDNQVGLTD